MTDGGPAYTKIPNAVLDAMPDMSEAELRVVLAIARKTVGWGKERDRISLKLLIDLTGLSRQGVLDGLDAALAHGWVERAPVKNSYAYALKMVYSVDHSSNRSTHQTGLPTRPKMVYSVDQNEPKMVYSVDTQKKESKEKKEKGDRGGVSRRPRAPKKPIAEIVIETLADECKIDQAIATKTQRDQLYQSAGILARAGAKLNQSPEQIADAIRYVASFFRLRHWRGKKGEPPTPALIREVWRDAMDARGNSNGRPLRPSLNGHSERGKLSEADPERGF